MIGRRPPGLRPALRSPLSTPASTVAVPAPVAHHFRKRESRDSRPPPEADPGPCLAAPGAQRPEPAHDGSKPVRRSIVLAACSAAIAGSSEFICDTPSVGAGGLLLVPMCLAAKAAEAGERERLQPEREEQRRQERERLVQAAADPDAALALARDFQEPRYLEPFARGGNLDAAVELAASVAGGAGVGAPRGRACGQPDRLHVVRPGRRERLPGCRELPEPHGVPPGPADSRHSAGDAGGVAPGPLHAGWSRRDAAR